MTLFENTPKFSYSSRQWRVMDSKGLRSRSITRCVGSLNLKRLRLINVCIQCMYYVNINPRVLDEEVILSFRSMIFERQVGAFDTSNHNRWTLVSHGQEKPSWSSYSTDLALTNRKEHGMEICWMKNLEQECPFILGLPLRLNFADGADTSRFRQSNWNSRTTTCCNRCLFRMHSGLREQQRV